MGPIGASFRRTRDAVGQRKRDVIERLLRLYQTPIAVCPYGMITRHGLLKAQNTQTNANHHFTRYDFNLSDTW